MMITSDLMEIIQNKLKGWWVYIVQMSPNFVLAIIVMITFYLAARFFRRFSANFILRISKNQSVSALLSGAIYTAMIIFGMMTALNILELDKTVSSLLAGVGIIGLALGFAFQDLTSNFISGAFIALKRPFDVGHIIETNGFLGTVDEIRLRSTTLKTHAGLHVIIPNKDIFQKAIINYSKTDGRKVELEFLIPNTVDTSEMQNKILNALYDLKEQDWAYSIELFLIGIEPPNLKIQVSFWTNRIDPRDFMGARHQAIALIVNKFKEMGIYNRAQS